MLPLSVSESNELKCNRSVFCKISNIQHSLWSRNVTITCFHSGKVWQRKTDPLQTNVAPACQTCRDEIAAKGGNMSEESSPAGYPPGFLSRGKGKYTVKLH